MDLNQSILNHLFLPYDLPSSADDDHLTGSNHQNEYKLLKLVNQFFESLDSKKTLSIFPILKNCVHRWSILQNPNECSVSTFQSTIEKLEPGDFLSIYFHAQNSAILIEIDQNLSNQALISAWQIALSTETITSSLESHLSCFPVPTFRLSDRSQLRSQTQCELLVDFMTNTIEYAKVNKSSNTFNELREVPVAHYVCQYGGLTNSRTSSKRSHQLYFRKNIVIKLDGKVRIYLFDVQVYGWRSKGFFRLFSQNV